MFFISSFHLLQISRNKGFRRYFSSSGFWFKEDLFNEHVDQCFLARRPQMSCFTHNSVYTNIHILEAESETFDEFSVKKNTQTDEQISQILGDEFKSGRLIDWLLQL